jgi:hypothetical protein
MPLGISAEIVPLSIASHWYSMASTAPSTNSSTAPSTHQSRPKFRVSSRGRQPPPDDDEMGDVLAANSETEEDD